MSFMSCHEPNGNGEEGGTWWDCMGEEMVCQSMPQDEAASY